MAADRDLEVAFVRAWAPGAGPRLDVWDALAASGVRGLRVLNESAAVRSLLLTEANPAAAEVLRENASAVPGARAEFRDARVSSDARFDLVDLDPYGSPLPFLDTALSAVRPGGVLAVTATDMMVLAGAQPDAAARRYGGRPVRGRLGPEGGLRLLLAAVGRAARAQGHGMRVLLAYSRDHYVRGYVEISESGAVERELPIGVLEPDRFEGPALGPGGPFGPLWLGPILDPAVIDRLAPPPSPADPAAVTRLIERFREEVAVDVPFYYESNSLARQLGLTEPPSLESFLRALRAAGHRAARAHPRPEGFRTDAPRAEVERVARTLAAQSQNARVRA